MRSLAVTSFASALLVACGTDVALPGADLSMALHDAAAPVDLAPRADLASDPDLASPPDLAAEPDLAQSMPGFCGGLAGRPCPGGQFCDYPQNCGVADEPGTCRPRPQACPDVYDPVCGCDGKVYGNDCDRQAAGVSLRDRGICGCEPSCGQGNYCVMCKNLPVCMPVGVLCK